MRVCPKHPQISQNQWYSVDFKHLKEFIIHPSFTQTLPMALPCFAGVFAGQGHCRRPTGASSRSISGIPRLHASAWRCHPRAFCARFFFEGLTEPYFQCQADWSESVRSEQCHFGEGPPSHGGGVHPSHVGHARPSGQRCWFLRTPWARTSALRAARGATEGTRESMVYRAFIHDYPKGLWGSLVRYLDCDYCN